MNSIEPNSTPKTSEVVGLSVQLFPFHFHVFFVVMDKNIENCDLSKHYINTKATLGVTKSSQGKMFNKCNQCEYKSSDKGHIRMHLNTQGGEKVNKCNQCGYASSHACNLRAHLKTHTGKKSNKCKQM